MKVNGISTVGDEPELAAGVARGDTAAFEALYNRYVPLVYSLALRITRSRSDADEVVVEAFWQLWKQAERYDPARGEFQTWILTIARTRALDRLRVRRRQAVPELDDETVSQVSDPPAECSPEEDVWLAERGRLLRIAFKALPVGQRMAIELAFFEGLTHTEIAERLGASLGTIKTRIRLGLLKLRGQLSQCAGVDLALGGTSRIPASADRRLCHSEYARSLRDVG